MQIFKDELAIAEQILENRSVAYTCQLEPLSKENTSSIALASIYDKTPSTPDLYFVKSVFVTTNKNLNDDVFLPTEVWSARSTPVDKMWNIEHDHSRVVGHITSTWAIDEDNEVIAEDTEVEKLPQLFHLCCAGVIYAKWQKEELQDQANELIQEIEAGNYKTSMEAIFSSFNFLVEKGDEVKVIARDESTSFLTKHLRAYGGTGEYDGYKLGRAISNIIFSGNALVKNPANPDSIIFSKISKKSPNFHISQKTGVYKNCEANLEENTMSDILETQVADLKEQVKSLQATNKELQDELSSASVEKYEAEIASLKEQLATVEAEYMKDKEKKKKMEQDMKASEDALAAALKEAEDAKAQLENLKAELTKAARVAQLVEAGLDKKDAEVKASEFANLSDEQFASFASIFKTLKSTQAEKSDDDKAEEAEATLASAEDEESDADASVDDSDSDQVRRQELFAAVASRYEDKFKEKK